MKRLTLTFLTTLALFIGIAFGLAETNNARVQGPQGPTGPAIDNPGRKLQAISLTKAAVIGGNSFSGTVRLEFVAPKGGTIVSLTTEPAFNPEGGNAAFVTSRVTVPQGEATATFEIRTFPVQSNRPVTVRASAGGITKTASFTVEPVQVVGLVITPTSGVGPFDVRASVILNAPAVEQTDVTLASNNTDVVAFGFSSTRIVRFERGERALTGIQMLARQVPELTTVNITASLNGATQTRPLRIQPRP